MELQDYNIFEQRVSTYRTNHIHLCLDGDFNLDFGKMSVRDFASLVHEYVHYLQHFHTLYGLNLCSGFNAIFSIYREYFEQHNKFYIPLFLPLDKSTAQFKENHGRIHGDEECKFYNVDEVEVSPLSINEAKKNNTAVSIGVYDFTNNQADENGFKFGYCCVIEGMAHLIQQKINPQIHHQEIKYLAIQHICNNYCKKEIAQNTNLVISACVCALMFKNPGVAFFDVLDYISQSNITDGRYLFSSFIRDSNILYQRKRQTVAAAVSAFLSRLEKSLTLATGTDLDYYKKVIDNCKYYIQNDRNPIIDLVYEFDLSNRTFLYKLFDICGYPTIEDNSTYYPPLNADGKPYIECAALLGKELIIKRIQATQTTICPGFERFCKNKQYTNDDPITPECQCEQWKRNGPPCLMSAAFHYYKLDNHTIIQKDINK